MKHPGRDVLNGGQRVPVSCFVTLPEGKGISCPESWVTLKSLVCNGENIRRKCMDHTVDPGRVEKPRGSQYMRATTAGRRDLELGR